MTETKCWFSKTQANHVEFEVSAHDLQAVTVLCVKIYSHDHSRMWLKQLVNTLSFLLPYLGTVHVRP